MTEEDGTPEEAETSVDPTNPGRFTEDDGASKAGEGAERTLFALLRLQPFIDLYKRSGEGSLPFRGKVAFALELFVHFVTALLLLAIIATVFWKAIAPVPHFP